MTRNEYLTNREHEEIKQTIIKELRTETADLRAERNTLSARVAELEAEEQKQRLGREYLLFLMRQFTEAAGDAVGDDWEPTTLWTTILMLKGRVDEAEARSALAEALLSDLCRLTGADSHAAAVSVVATMLHGADAQAYGGVVRAYAEMKAANADLDKVLTAVAETLGVPCDSDEILGAAEWAAASQAREAGMREALRFYANREHMVGDWDGWEDASGEPPNWLNAPDDHGAMLEDGGVARAALSPAQPITTTAP